MFKKRFLIYILMIFIVALGCVSAQEVADDNALSYENQDIGEISSDFDDSAETTDILSDDEPHATFQVSNDTNYLKISVLDDDGNYVTGGLVSYIFEETGEGSQFELRDDYYTLNLYKYYDALPGNLNLYYDGNYQVDNLTVYCDKLTDTIDASDVVDDSVFSAICYDQYGNAKSGSYVIFWLWDYDMEDWNDIWASTDYGGFASIKIDLEIGNYPVRVENMYTGQVKEFWWNITHIDPNKYSWINATVDGYYLNFPVLNRTNGTIYDSRIFIYANDSYIDECYGFKYNIYGIGLGTYNITISSRESQYYYDSSTSLILNINDTIYVNESFYNTTKVTLQLVDYNGVPLNNSTVRLIYNNRGYSALTDENGYLTYDFSLLPGNYTIYITNGISLQQKDIEMEILEINESKIANINVSPDGFKFTINVTDNDGNPIDGGLVYVYVEGIIYAAVEVNNGTAEYIYGKGQYIPESYDSNLMFLFDNVDYYLVNETVEFSYNDTITSSNVDSGLEFGATFYDMAGNPLVNQEVLFLLCENEYLVYPVLFNITNVTDENGFAVVVLPESYFEYCVLSTNLVTNQVKSNIWINKKYSEIMPIMEYVDENTGFLPFDSDKLVIQFSPNATGRVYVYNYGMYYSGGSVVNETFTLDVSNGTYAFDVSYSGNDEYCGASKYFVLHVGGMYNPVMTVSEDIVADYLDDVDFTVNLKYDDNPIFNASVEVTIGNNTYDAITDENGSVVIPIALDAGIYDVYVVYNGNMTYNPVNKTTTLTINKINTTINVNESTIGPFDQLIVTVDGNATGEIIVEVDGNICGATISDNIASINLILEKGTYDAIISYSGDNNYNNNSIESKITIEALTINITATADPITVGENAIITVAGLANATGKVIAKIGDNEYFTNIDSDVVDITVPGLTENVTAIVYYGGDANYDNASTTVDIVVYPKENTTIIVDAPDVTKYFGGSERFVVTVTDSEGNPLANKTVKININNRQYNRTTDANGTASMAIGLPSNTYNVTVTVDNQTINAVVTVLSTVNGTDVVKMYRNDTQYFATFLDSEGKYLADGTAVKFNINGVMYERKISGDKGLARLNINLPAGEYIITAINPKTGENAANNITVLATIVENKDITKYYKNATQYTLKVLGADGKPVGAGENVTFNINGVMYTRTTNASGIAKMNINLLPGDYVITADYKGYRVSNNIKVLPILTASDFTKKYGTPNQFVATVVDGQGNPYADQKVEFNINGIFYFRYTDNAGHAKLNINLQPGQYIITSSYGGQNLANTVTITP
jgi:hypothetical protein